MMHEQADKLPTLAELRQQIDALDDEILKALCARARCAQLVGEVKKAEGGEVIYYRPERERQVLERLASQNPGPLSNDEVKRLFREVMSACLALELPLEIAYLGPEGTFTQAAALKQFGHSANVRAKRSVEEVFRAVETGVCHYGVVPIENSTGGIVSHTLDSFVNSPLLICGEVEQRIEQNLLTHAMQLKEIERVYSHSQSLVQCRHWLAENMAHAELITVSSNAEAARIAAQDIRSAAIAGKMAAEQYQIPVRYPHIEDNGNNTTRFFIIGTQSINQTGRDKTSILVSSQNRPGSLYALLSHINRYNVNMLRIESRPSQKALWEYLFFIDLEGHQQQPEMQALFRDMQQSASLFRVLGSYPRA